MNNLIQHFNSPTEICLVLLAILCLVTLCFMTSYLFNNITPLYKKIIILYILLILCQIILAYLDLLYFQSISLVKYRLMNSSAYAFVVVEFLTFSYFLKHAIQESFIDKVILSCIIIFILLSINFWLSLDTISKAISFQSSFETILLLPVCLIYFYLLLKNPPVLILTREPFFWIVIGILFLLICITPFYLMISYFKPTPEMQIVDHIAYMIIVGFFTKAFYTR